MGMRMPNDRHERMAHDGPPGENLWRCGLPCLRGMGLVAGGDPAHSDTGSATPIMVSCPARIITFCPALIMMSCPAPIMVSWRVPPPAHFDTGFATPLTVCCPPPSCCRVHPPRSVLSTCITRDKGPATVLILHMSSSPESSSCCLLSDWFLRRLSHLYRRHSLHGARAVRARGRVRVISATLLHCM